MRFKRDIDRTNCPAGSQYYTCTKNAFSGCCRVDPCALDSCPQEVPPVGVDESPSADIAKPAPTTDSGITHTIPNSSVVTVTKHTTVFSEAPLPTETSTIPNGSGSPTASGTQSSATAAPSSGGGGSFPTGAIVGGAVGGILAILILSVLFWAWRRKRLGKQDSAVTGEDEPALGDTMHGDEKAQSPASGGGDPFAPFGGRIDQPKVTAFEMDGTSTGPVELPGTAQQEPPKVHEAPADEARGGSPPVGSSAAFTNN